MIKTQVVIDGSYLLFKGVFILKKSRSIKDDLDVLLMNDFNRISGSFGFDRIFFVSDKGASWRRQIYPEYKGNRVKDESIDWDAVFATYEIFKNKVKKKRNVKFLQLDEVEGDDLISHIVKDGNKEGYSSLIVSSDADINQILEFDIIKGWINVQWNYKFNDERIYVPENYQLFMESMYKPQQYDEDDIFSSSPDDDNEFLVYLEQLISRTKVKEIKCEESLFCKIVSGDKGDNISSIIKTRNGKQDEEGRGIGKDGAKTVYNLYKETFPEVIDFYGDEFINRLIEIIFYYKGLKDPSIKKSIADKIILNRRLVYLDKTYIPENISESIVSSYEKVKNEVKEYVPEEKQEIIIKDIKEEFRVEDTGKEFEEDDFFTIVEEEEEEKDKFNIDDFWEL